LANVARSSAKGIFMKIMICAAVTAALGLAGCATMVNGGSEDIAVLTPPVAGANCVLSNQEGSWSVVTPTVAHVQRAYDDLMVKCDKPGYQEAWKSLPSHTDWMTLANIANAGVGVGIDSYTGAIDGYPHSVQLPMQPAVPAAQPTPESPPAAPTQEPMSVPAATPPAK
jgi:hypothetical protein